MIKSCHSDSYNVVSKIFFTYYILTTLTTFDSLVCSKWLLKKKDKLKFFASKTDRFNMAKKCINLKNNHLAKIPKIFVVSVVSM
jgi:hypothetical protein